MPIEFTKKFGSVDVDYEIGFQYVHTGSDGWITGLVVGHDFTEKLELEVELHNLRSLPSLRQSTRL